MNRRTLLATLTALPIGLPALAQDQRTLNEVSKYLNQLRSIKGRFMQVNSNGSRVRGNYYLQRPGFVRFEYDNGRDLVMADGVNVGIFDSKSNTGVKKYPLGTTPLRFLLRRDIDLAGQGVATNTSNDGKNTKVTLRDPKKPNDGSMTLVFSNRPPALTQWTVLDRQGQRTTVVLENIEKTSRFERNFFNIELTARRRG